MDTPTKTKLDVDSIETLPELQNRPEGINPDEVLRLAKDILKVGLKVPLEVFAVDGRYLLTSGHHRMLGMLAIREKDRRRFQTVKVQLYSGTMADAVEHSFRMNQRHGVPLTREEQMQVAYQAHLSTDTDRFRTMGQRKVAPELGVSHGSIGYIRHSLTALCVHQYEDGEAWRKIPGEVLVTFPKWWQVRKFFSQRSDSSGFSMRAAVRAGKAEAAEWQASELKHLREQPAEFFKELTAMDAKVRAMKSEVDAVQELAQQQAELAEVLPPSLTVDDGVTREDVEKVAPDEACGF